MSFFKDLFSSLSSNKTSEKPSQNTELLTNSAKRVIPSIADYSYRNTGLNTMTFEDLKDLLKNDVFEKKLNRACGDNIVYTDMLKKDIVYYYNLMDDLNDHICSILTHRRLLSVDEWMDIFSDMQRKNLIHNIYEAKNSDILDDYKYIYGDDLIRRLESDYTWMYINSSLLLGCVSAIYEKPHFGHDLFDSSSEVVVDEINKCCENWTAHFFSLKSSTSNSNKRNVQNAKSYNSYDSSYKAEEKPCEPVREIVKEVTEEISTSNAFEEIFEEVYKERIVETEVSKDDFKEDTYKDIYKENTYDIYETETANTNLEDDFKEVYETQSCEIDFENKVDSLDTTEKYLCEEVYEEKAVEAVQVAEVKVAEVVKLAEVKVFETSTQTVEDTFEDTFNDTYSQTYANETYINKEAPSILQKCEEDEIVENSFAFLEDDDELVVADSVIKKYEDFDPIEEDFEIAETGEYAESEGYVDTVDTVDVSVDEPSEIETSESSYYEEDKADLENNTEHLLSEDAKNAIWHIVQQSFKYTDFSASTYQDFQDFMNKNVFDKKLNRLNCDIRRYSDDLKKNILYYYNLIEDLKYHLHCLITNKQLIKADKWMEEFGKLQIANRVHEIAGTPNADILETYDKIAVQNLVSSLERDYTWMYLSSNLWLGCIYAIYEYPEFAPALFAEPAGCIVDEVMYECDDVMINWRSGR